MIQRHELRLLEQPSSPYRRCADSLLNTGLCSTQIVVLKPINLAPVGCIRASSIQVRSTPWALLSIPPPLARLKLQGPGLVGRSRHLRGASSLGKRYVWGAWQQSLCCRLDWLVMGRQGLGPPRMLEILQFACNMMQQECGHEGNVTAAATVSLLR